MLRTQADQLANKTALRFLGDRDDYDRDHDQPLFHRGDGDDAQQVHGKSVRLYPIIRGLK